MQKFFKIFFWGILISFLGSLPLGTMNVTVTQISLKSGLGAGLSCAVGAMIVELVIVRTALIAMSWISRRQKVFKILEFVTSALIFFLAIATLLAAYEMSGFSSPLSAHLLNPFWTGVLLSATNPLHIPFWLGWTTVLINKSILQPVASAYNVYIIGIGIGTMLGFLVFIFCGNYFVDEINQHQVLINYVVGSALLVTAILQFRKLREQPVVIKNVKEES